MIRHPFFSDLKINWILIYFVSTVKPQVLFYILQIYEVIIETYEQRNFNLKCNK